MHDLIKRYILTIEDEELEEVVRIPNVKKTLSNIKTRLSSAKYKLQLSKTKLQQRLNDKKLAKIEKKINKQTIVDKNKADIKRFNKKTGKKRGKETAIERAAARKKQQGV